MTSRHGADEARPVWRPALFAEPSGNGRVRCTLCPFRCDLADGRTGVCRVRRNRSGVLETATFTAAATHLDAVERKPLYHVRPGSRVLTVAGPGCTFRCDYCVNHRLSQYGRADGSSWRGAPADAAALAARAAEEGAALGLSYSEPGLAPELTLALAEEAEPLGVPIVWKSNGFLTRHAIRRVAPVLLAVNIDVKAADEAAHLRLTGAPLRPVLDAVELFREEGVWVEVSTPLVPGVSDEPGQLGAIARTLAAVDPALPWHLLRFTPDFRMTAESPTAPSALRTGRDIGEEAGLLHVYVERALGEEGRTTRCPSCRSPLVRRGLWSTTLNEMSSDACARCAHPVPGRWGRNDD
ncbi:radical SAM protein [Streptomyces spongiae]|uniref:Radical SAM protein n=2 Tax=Streptomyces spongiae TaxID=565072 RepID=A0A5N8XG51_9ACTN|nr:radical SAM protein [Streptomyces spongiae]